MYDVIGQNYESPRWTGEITDCSMPMTFDTYSNCGFSCCYCFSQFQRAVGASKKDYRAKKVKTVNVEKIKRIFLEPDSSQFADYVKQRKVMQWGGLSDPFCWIEKELGVSLELLKFFKEINYPLCFSTKGVWWLYDKRYTDLFKNQTNWNVKLSIITLDERKALLVEKGVATPRERIEGLRLISKLNCGGATLRLRPFIIGVSDPSFRYLIPEASRAGATAMSTEFFCLERRAVNTAKKNYSTISQACGFDIVDFYAKNSSGAGYLRLNKKLKEPYIKEMETLAKQNGLRFYVSDAHFKECCHNGSCCGLPENFNYSRGQFTQALMICKEKGIVKWSDIAKDASYLKKISFKNATGFNTTSTRKRQMYDGCSLYDYVRTIWNNLKHSQNPYNYFSHVMVPVSLDEEKNIVYKYNP